jgi:threonine dehydrogenase-like Zn-dependent dehydrogenase
MQNPSVVLYGPHNAKIEDKDIPEIATPHDVIVRINYVGVCGSDVSYFLSTITLQEGERKPYATNSIKHD